MLPPNERTLYVDALKPPSGYVLGQAVATTYSIDLATLLSIPVALALPQLDVRSLKEASAIALMEATRTVSARLTVFCDSTGMAAPSGSHVLYGLLEPAVYEISAPLGGSLHAKVWLLRFDPEDAEHAEPLMRLVVLSRNLTFDRSWDVSVQLEGRLTGRGRKQNQPLQQLLELLPSRCIRPMEPARREALAAFAEQVRRTEWTLPDGFEALHLHLLGAGRRAQSWAPERSSRLVVVSPFLGAEALRMLRATTKEGLALISRPEELDRTPRDARELFGQLYTLHEAAEREDGEDELDDARRTQLRGLHAKIYLAERGWYTHVYLGSANATHAALTAGINIELLVELIGRTSAVPQRGIAGLLGKDGFREVLVPYDPAQPVVELDPDQARADELLRGAERTVALAPISLTFAREGEHYRPKLLLEGELSLPALTELSAWLVTVDPSMASEAYGLFEQSELPLPSCAPESATSFVAFRLMAEHASAPVSFVRNLPTATMPVERDARVLRLIVHNRDRFYRYLLGLLDGFERETFAAPEHGERGSGGVRAAREAGLLERLIRARARHPERIESIRAIVDTLRETPESREVLSEEFLGVWQVISEVQP